MCIRIRVLNSLVIRRAARPGLHTARVSRGVASSFQTRGDQQQREGASVEKRGGWRRCRRAINKLADIVFRPAILRAARLVSLWQVE